VQRLAADAAKKAAQPDFVTAAAAALDDITTETTGHVHDEHAATAAAMAPVLDRVHRRGLRARLRSIVAAVAGTRTRQLGTAAVLAAITAASTLFAGICVSQSTVAAVSTAQPTTAATTDSRPSAVCGNMHTADGLTRLFADLSTTAWDGADVGLSVPLSDGRTMWIYGDTVKGEQTADGQYAPGWRWVHNSAVFTTADGCATGADSRDEILPSDGETFFWPTAAVQTRPGYVDVFASATTWPGTGDLSTIRYHGTRRFTVAVDGDRVRTVSSTKISSGPIAWGAGISRQRDGSVLIYGTEQPTTATGAPATFGKRLYVARAQHPDTPAGQYTVWAGPSRGFVSGLANAVPIVEGTQGVSTAVSAIDGTTSVVTKIDDALGTDVSLLTMNFATGAVNRQKLFTSKSTAHDATYLPYVHLIGDQAYVSVSHNRLNGALPDHGNDYKPTFRTVTLTRHQQGTHPRTVLNS